VRRTLRLLAIAAAAVAGATLYAAQNPPMIRDGPPLRMGVDLTVVTATVFDADGHLVSGLARENFEIYEDGEAQPLTQYTRERVPVGLGLLIDVSDSMYGQRLVDARAAVERFLIDLLAPTDMYFVMAFNHEPRLMTPWTNDPADVRTGLDRLRASGGTAIYDAIVQALPIVDRRTRERAALVIISDGADTASDTTLSELRSVLVRSDAFVYAVAIDSPSTRTINRSVNPSALAEITNQSGGRTEVVHATTELAAATAKIAEELNTQYVLGYATPHPGDGKYHSIRVRVKGEGYRVRARNGYVAAPATKGR